MHIGRLLICSSTFNLSVFTPWMPRIADNARVGYEVIQLVGEPVLSVEVLHKNSDDLSRNGGGTPLSVSWDTTSVGNTTMKSGTASGLKEMVRFHLILEFTGISETEAVLYRFLDITWFNAAG